MTSAQRRTWRKYNKDVLCKSEGEQVQTHMKASRCTPAFAKNSWKIYAHADPTYGVTSCAASSTADDTISITSAEALQKPLAELLAESAAKLGWTRKLGAAPKGDVERRAIEMLEQLG